jgi:hypothetical protein
VPTTGRRQRWYKSIYPLVDAYSSTNGLRWRAQGWDEDVHFAIGVFKDKLLAAMASQQWLTETVSKVALTLSRLKNLLSRKLTTNLSVARTGHPNEHPAFPEDGEDAQTR